MTDPDNAYRMLSVTGEVAAVTTEGARDNIDELSMRYTGEAYPPENIQSDRVILEIEPQHVSAYEG